MEAAIASTATDPSAIGPDTPIVDRFRALVAAAPDALALITPAGQFTYADIDRWSDAVAAALIAADAPLDRAIAIVVRDNVSLMPAGMGVVKAGHFFVTVDAADPDERISLILSESNAALCLVDSADTAPPAARALPLVAIPRFPVTPSGSQPQRPPHPFVHLIFTSGTTGKPKAVLTRQKNYVRHAVGDSWRFGRAPGERAISTSLPGFTRAAQNIFNNLLTGTTACAFDARNESLTALAGWIASQRITLLSLTPALFRRLMAAAPATLDLSSVKRLRMGADLVTVADIEAFKKHFPRGCVLNTGFASTETGSVFRMVIDHDTPIPGPLVPMGRPHPAVEVQLLDENGNEVGVGEVGEIVVTGEQVVEGYWNDPELTAQRFRSHPDRPGVRTFYTGDLAKRDADGLHYFVGRRDVRIKIHGRRINPAEVEAAIVAIEGVREAVVIGKPDVHGELHLVAYVVMREGHTLVPRAIRSVLRETSPAWMVPSRIFALDAIPFTRAGKADRSALVARQDDEGDTGSGASDDLERKLAAIWSEVIGTPVHAGDDFFDDLGAESVVAAHLVTAIENELGRSIPLSLIVELNTVRKMAAYFRTAPAEKPLAVAIQKGGGLPPLFCVAGGEGGVMNFRALGQVLGSDRPLYGLQPHGFDLRAFPDSRATIVASYADAVRKIQPSGPYYLAGYSAGGQIAFEMARHFELAGEQVAFVGVFDTVHGSIGPRAIKDRFANRIGLLLNDPRRLLRLPREAALRLKKWIRRVLARRIAEKGEPLPQWLLDTRTAMRKAKRDHSHGPYSGPITLFRAREGMRRVSKAEDLGWRAVAPGGVTIVDVDGDHVSILTTDVASLGGALAQALALEAQRRKGSKAQRRTS
jgi:amino acid adenylation domain-containing protein